MVPDIVLWFSARAADRREHDSTTTDELDPRVLRTAGGRAMGGIGRVGHAARPAPRDRAGAGAPDAPRTRARPGADPQHPVVRRRARARSGLGWTRRR